MSWRYQYYLSNFLHRAFWALLGEFPSFLKRYGDVRCQTHEMWIQWNMVWIKPRPQVTPKSTVAWASECYGILELWDQCQKGLLKASLHSAPLSPSNHSGEIKTGPSLCLHPVGMRLGSEVWQGWRSSGSGVQLNGQERWMRSTCCSWRLLAASACSEVSWEMTSLCLCLKNPYGSSL